MNQPHDVDCAHIFRVVDPAGQTPHGRWWDATFHTVTAVVGVGVLSLPYAFSYLTWTGGVIALALTTATSFYTAYLLASLHEEKDGRRWGILRHIGLFKFTACKGAACMQERCMREKLRSMQAWGSERSRAGDMM